MRKHEKTRENSRKHQKIALQGAALRGKWPFWPLLVTFLISSHPVVLFSTEKHGKSGKAREKQSRKQSIWNTIEQYTGLKLSAASLFSEKTFSKSQKSQNRHFPRFEQYGRLKSRASSGLTDSGGQE